MLNLDLSIIKFKYYMAIGSKNILSVKDRDNQPGRYSKLEKMVARANQTGDVATLNEINTNLQTAMQKAGILPKDNQEPVKDNNGWQPISDERRAQIEAMPSEVWYVDEDGRKKQATQGVIPSFPPLSRHEESEIISSLKPVNLIIDNPMQFSQQEWNESIQQIPNFEGNKENAAHFMYNIAYGITDVHNKQAKKNKSKQYDIPSVIIYYGKNKDNLGIHYEASKNQIIISSSYLAKYSIYDKSSRVILRSDIKGNDIIFDGKIGNCAKLIGVEEATHSVSNQQEKITTIVGDARKVDSLAEYDATDAEYEALLEQLDFAKKERMDKETIQTINLRIRRAKLVRRRLGKNI